MSDAKGTTPPNAPLIRQMELLPQFYADNVEMLDIATAEKLELDALWEALERLLANQFIKTADIHRIRQWERLLRIRPDTANQNLEQRREIILLRLQMRPPLTRRWLEAFLSERFGDNYTLNIIHNTYTMILSIFHHDMVVLMEFQRLLRHLIPITMILDFGQIYVEYFEAGDYQAATESVLIREYIVGDITEMETSGIDNAAGVDYEIIREVFFE